MSSNGGNHGNGNHVSTPSRQQPSQQQYGSIMQQTVLPLSEEVNGNAEISGLGHLQNFFKLDPALTNHQVSHQLYVLELHRKFF